MSISLLLGRGRDRLETLLSSPCHHRKRMILLLARGCDLLKTLAIAFAPMSKLIPYSLGDAINWKLSCDYFFAIKFV